MQSKAPSRRHSCVRCIQLKVKCVPVENGRCQRCARLNRPCAFPDGSRRNTSIRNSHIDIIQHQVDTLVAQLRPDKVSYFEPMCTPLPLRKEDHLNSFD
ncbi:hypothetical protein BJX63DRAFT_415841 [Aspergillus granulosus]|uniref:Zn(2)-C6 fungal-type domain-containing protein n=1 Tax=Aspergillus granulosus TaxID=176169 RepID=A0ABR4GST5_9EURO